MLEPFIIRSHDVCVLRYPGKQEFCSLLDLVSWDNSAFQDFYARNMKQIIAGRRKYASDYEKKRTSELILELQGKAAPYILQRSMKEHFKGKLPGKDEFVVLVKPSEKQWNISKRFMGSDLVQHFKDSGSRFHAFAAIARLIMIAYHPYFAEQQTDANVQEYLSSLKANHDDGSELDMDNVLSDEGGVHDNDYLKSSNQFIEILRDSPKLRMCKDLLVNLVQNKHKILVFAGYRKPLDFLAHVLQHSNIGYYRVDGPTSQGKRDTYISEFNSKKSRHQIMLVTKGAGGLGLTLTGADRVIILEPSWNPSVDAQAVGRAFRIGQTRRVEVYRILTAGLIEEKASTLVTKRCFFFQVEVCRKKFI